MRGDKVLAAGSAGGVRTAESEIASRVRMWSYMSLLFVAALSIPTASSLAIMLLFVISKAWMKDITRGVFLLPLAVLGCFSLSYFGTLYYYGELGFRYIFHYLALVIFAYASGLAMGRNALRRWPESVNWLIIAIVAGFVFFSYFSMQAELPLAGSFGIAKRAGRNIWKSDTIINATNIGMMVSIAMSQAPVLFFCLGWRGGRRPDFLLAAVLSLCVTVGFYVNAMLLNRSPLLAMSLAFAVTWFVYITYIGRSVKRRITGVILSSAFIFAVLYLMLSYVSDLSKYMLYSRIESAGLRSDRIDAWIAMLSNIDQSLVGGRVVTLGTINYAHNIWLDVLWVTGIVPMSLLFIFHIMHVRDMLALVRSGLPPTVVISMLCMGVSFFVGFMVEPALQASIIYFSLSCFFLGILRRTVCDQKSLPAHSSAGMKS